MDKRMKKLCTWAFGTMFAAPVNKEPNAGGGERSSDNENTQGTVSSPEHISEIRITPTDPKVAEFFKHFPEPYKQKAIERYSSRDGIFRWDFIRDMYMQEEKFSAMNGIFLEDKREAEELAKQKQELDRIEALEERKKQFFERDIPEWEKQLLKVIPLQPWDTMVWKLVQAGGLSACGIAILCVEVADKTRSSLPKSQGNRRLVGAVGVFLWLNVIAYARLMDKGFFDRSVDDRSVKAKMEDDLRGAFRDIQDFLKNVSRP